MDDLTRKKLTDAFGPHFVAGLEALRDLYRAEMMAQRAAEPPSMADYRPRELPPLVPLIGPDGFEITIKLKRTEHGFYEASSSAGYSAPALLQHGIYVSTRGRSALEALTRLAPQVGEAIEQAESIDECEQISRRNKAEIEGS